MRPVLLLPLALALTASPLAWGQTLDGLAPTPADALAALTDTTEATAEAALRVEHARLILARHELRAATK